MSGPRFSIIPAGAVLDSRLKARDLQVLCVFGKHTDRAGWCRRSQVVMAREMDCARSTVQASIERLVAAGWLQKRVLSTPHQEGERDCAHEYRVMLDVLDEPQDVVAPPADRSAPPAAPESAPINVPLLTDPLLTLGAQARGGGDFNILWNEWPDLSRPDSFEAAQAIFRKMSSIDQALAVETARAYRRVCVARKQPANMIPYFRERRFAELVGAPELDADGDFIITPDRPEWSHWLGAIRRQFGEPGVQSTVKIGKILRKTRWPPADEQAA